MKDIAQYNRFDGREETVKLADMGVGRPTEQIRVKQLFAVLQRRKKTLLTTFSVTLLLTLIYVWWYVPAYTAQVSVMIQSRIPEIVNMDAVTEQLSVDRLTMQSEIEVLRSRDLAARVIEQLQLRQDPDFNPALSQSRWRQLPLLGWLAEPLAKLRSWLDAASLRLQTSETDADLAEQQRAATEDAVIDVFQKKLQVSQRQDSRVLIVEFTSPDRFQAARIANAVAEQYILQQKDEKLEAARRATEWLTDQVATLQERVDVADREMENFKQRTGLIGEGEGISLLTEQIAALNRQLAQALAGRIELEAKMRRFLALTRPPDGASQTAPDAVSGATASAQDDTRDPSEGLDAVAAMFGSEALRALRSEQLKLQSEAAALAAEYGELHPRMLAARASLDELRAAVDAELAEIGGGLAQELALATEREALLRQTLEDLKQQARDASVAAIGLRKLEREAETSRTFLKAFMSRAQETSAQTDINLQQADASVISRANIPDSPRLSKRLLLLMALLVSLAVAVMLAFFRELLQEGFSDSQDVEQATSAPVLGIIPRLRRTSLISEPPLEYLQKYPRSGFSESIRSIRTGLLFAFGDEGPSKSVLIASAEPSEGKSTIAACLAHTHALTGRKVVVIDADVRRPTQHRLFHVSGRAGLIDFLTGQQQLKEVLQTDPKTGVDVITAGQLSGLKFDPPDLFGSVEMDMMLDALAEMYDLIVLDSAPLMQTADARVLSRRVAATVLVLRAAQSKRAYAALASKQINTAGGHLAGVVLNMVSAKDSFLAYGGAYV